MANYPQELAQDAMCQSHTGHMTGPWFLRTLPLRLNADEWAFVCLESYLFISWMKGIIVMPVAGRGRKLAFPYYLTLYHSPHVRLHSWVITRSNNLPTRSSSLRTILRAYFCDGRCRSFSSIEVFTAFPALWIECRREQHGSTRLWHWRQENKRIH